MPTTSTRPVTEAIVIEGPAGVLEGILDTPQDGRAVAHVGVVCHPHPMHGGAMTNKVAHMLARSFNEAGAPAVRFNFRGVGASAGAYDEGDGETQDALAVLDWAAQRWPQAHLWLAGFSFGGAVAIHAATLRNVQRLVTVAPAVERVRTAVAEPPSCPWLIVQGDQDELVNPLETQRWASSLAAPPTVKMLPGVDHFFHGRLSELREVVVSWLTNGPS